MINKSPIRIPFLGLISSILRNFLRLQKLKSDFIKYNIPLTDGGRFVCNKSEIYPCFNEDTEYTGFDPHYLFHTAWAARLLAKNKPELHIDVSSDLRFVTLVSAFIKVNFYDYRPANFHLSGLDCRFADLTSLPFEESSITSLSCMHVVEHIGLGRYGDQVDPKGDIKASTELKRVLSQDGQLYFVVPVGGEPKIQYNAHRIYSYEMVVSMFSDLKIVNFSLVTDEGDFIENATELDANKQRYGCGCWLFKK